MKLLRYLSWMLRAVLFLMLLLFALKNTEPVTLRFFFGESWQVPLVLLLLIFFAFGAVVRSWIRPFTMQQFKHGHIQMSITNAS